MHRLLQMVSVLRICLNFLPTRATIGSAVPGSKENISTKSSGGNSANDCGCGGPVLGRSREPPLLTWALPYSQAILGPAAAPPRSGPPPPPSPRFWPTICSSSSSSMSESLPWSCWLCRCRRRHLRDWPTPHSLAQTAIRSHQAGNITSLQHIDQLQSGGASWAWAETSLSTSHQRTHSGPFPRLVFVIQCLCVCGGGQWRP